MNTVIPGLGHIVTRRQRSGDDTNVSVLFDNGSHRIPLQDLGGGVTHVLSIALVLLGEPESTFLLIEEPESHLHEGAQRRLIEQIDDNRLGRQIMIATHSPIFMDKIMESSIYSITKCENKSIIEKRMSDRQQFEILDQLGVHPSTLLQSNCVIWIEGPTEKILINHWLSLWAPELKEHTHYSFVLTAGSHLDYYTTEASSTKEMIKITLICRNSFIVADRDTSPDSPPSKKAVQRIVSEMQTINQLALWITDDYEIEWYYPQSVLSRLWKNINWENFEQLRQSETPFFEALEKSGEADAKVKSASNRKPHWASLAIQNDSIPDWFGPAKDNALAKKIEVLAKFIRSANPSIPPAKDNKTCTSCSRPLP